MASDPHNLLFAALAILGLVSVAAAAGFASARLLLRASRHRE